MGEGVRPGVEHPHHRRGHCGGRLPAAHRYRWPHRSNTPPPSYALLLHGHSFYRIPVPIWSFLFLFGNEPWTAGGTSELRLGNVGEQHKDSPGDPAGLLWAAQRHCQPGTV